MEVSAQEARAIIVGSPSIEGDLAGRDNHPDQRLIDLWLYGKSVHTQRHYRRNALAFLRFVRKPLLTVGLEDVQAFGRALGQMDLVDGSRHCAMAAVKSLLAFGSRVGYLRFNVAAPMKMPAGKDTLNERILETGDVAAIIRGETDPRNKLILELLYVSGIRANELVTLGWRDVRDRRDGEGQITVFGKGRKTRTILLPADFYRTLKASRGKAKEESPVFLSRRRGALSTSQIRRIVFAAADRAGIKKKVSTHWMRHCHGSHALDGGAPISLVQATLGHSSVATTSRYLHARPNESSSKYLPAIGSADSDAVRSPIQTARVNQ